MRLTWAVPSDRGKQIFNYKVARTEVGGATTTLSMGGTGASPVTTSGGMVTYDMA